MHTVILDIDGITGEVAVPVVAPKDTPKEQLVETAMDIILMLRTNDMEVLRIEEA